METVTEQQPVEARPRWWNFDRDREIRREMLKRVLDVFKELRPNATRDYIQGCRARLAKLEYRLYAGANSLEEYQDVTTLKARLKAIVLELKARRVREQNPGAQPASIVVILPAQRRAFEAAVAQADEAAMRKRVRRTKQANKHSSAPAA